LLLGGLIAVNACYAADESTPTAAPGATEQPATAAPADAPGKAVHRAHKARRGATIDDRVKLLTAELKLDAAQQAGVKGALETQRTRLQQLWNDTSMAPAVRVGATQKISDDTADRIRALLNEEQKKKYIKPRQRDVAVGTKGADVEGWMSKTTGR
jgi:hypothetical protein